MSFKSTVKRTKEIELRVLNALNSYGKFYKSEEEFSTYDLYGETGGDKTLIEIKERSQIYSWWNIEKAKITRLLDLRDKAKYKIRLYLVMVVKDMAYLYNIDDVKNYQVEKKMMNNYTNESFKNGVKKSIKVVYSFPFTIHKLELKI